MVRTVAPLELRAQRLANREGLELDRSRQLATGIDQQRRAYIAHVFGADWASSLAYDLVLNLGRMSLEQGVLTVLDLAAHAEYQVSSETKLVLADMVLAARVRRRLVDDVDVHALQVEAVGDQVRISGYLSSSEELKRTLRLAEEVEGVARVEAALEVSPMLMRFMP